jgi:hypothetical protein
VVVLHVRNSNDLVLYFKDGGERIGEFVVLLVRQLYLSRRLLQVHVKDPITFRHDGTRTLKLTRGEGAAEPVFTKTAGTDRPPAPPGFCCPGGIVVVVVVLHPVPAAVGSSWV